MTHEEFRSSMKSTLPLAVQLRMQPMLIQSEWEVQIHHRQHLTSSGGIAICPKHALHQVIEAVELGLLRKLLTYHQSQKSYSSID